MSMRMILTHKTGSEDRQPLVLACGNVGPGGADQNYAISYCKHVEGQPSYEEEIHLDFMTIDRAGVTNEALLAVLIDRLTGLQAGPFACEENEDARIAAQLSLDALHRRTASRRQRGVENTLNT